VTQSHLQRRYDFIYNFVGILDPKCNGVKVHNYETSTQKDWKDMPTWHGVQLEASRASKPADESHNVGTKEAFSNPAVAAEDEVPTTEQLIAEWEAADEAMQNDFIGRWGPASPLHFPNRSAQDEARMLEGEQGDQEQDNGWNLF